MRKKVIMILAVVLMLGGCKKDKRADMSAYGIDSDKFYAMTMKESYGFLTKGSGFVYYGFSTCPWCLELVPILDEITKEYNIDIYYVDVRPQGEETRSYDDPDCAAVIELTKEYLSLKETDPWAGLPWLYVPQMFAVENGKIVGAETGIYPGHIAPEGKMTAEEAAILKDTLLGFFGLK